MVPLKSTILLFELYLPHLFNFFPFFLSSFRLSTIYSPILSLSMTLCYFLTAALRITNASLTYHNLPELILYRFLYK